MATKLYSGLLMTRVGDEVLINSGSKWSVHSMAEFESDAEVILKRSTTDNMYIMWYDWWADED